MPSLLRPFDAWEVLQKAFKGPLRESALLWGDEIDLWQTHVNSIIEHHNKRVSERRDESVDARIKLVEDQLSREIAAVASRLLEGEIYHVHIWSYQWWDQVHDCAGESKLKRRRLYEALWPIHPAICSWCDEKAEQAEIDQAKDSLAKLKANPKMKTSFFGKKSVDVEGQRESEKYCLDIIQRKTERIKKTRERPQTLKTVLGNLAAYQQVLQKCHPNAILVRGSTSLSADWALKTVHVYALMVMPIDLLLPCHTPAQFIAVYNKFSAAAARAATPAAAAPAATPAAPAAAPALAESKAPRIGDNGADASLTDDIIGSGCSLLEALMKALPSSSNDDKYARWESALAEQDITCVHDLLVLDGAAYARLLNIPQVTPLLQTALLLIRPL